MPAQLHFGTGDSVAAGTVNGATTNTITFSKSDFSNIVSGDVLIAWINNQSSSSGQTISAPSGWTQVGASPGSPSSSISRLSSVYYYPLPDATAISNLASSFTWTFSATARLACHVVRASGIDLTNPIDTASTAFYNANGLSSFSIPAVTTTTQPVLLVGVASQQNSAGGNPSYTSFMTDFRQYKTLASGSSISSSGSAIGYKLLDTVGSTGAIAVTSESGATQANAELIAFRALDDSVPPGPAELKLNFGAGDSTSAGTTGSDIADTLSFAKSNLSNMAVGDLLIAWIHNQKPEANVITAPAGWVRVGADQGLPDYSASRTSGMYYYKIETTSDITSLPSTITWTFEFGARVSGHITRATGVDLTNMFDVASSEFSVSGGSSSLSIAGLTTTVAPTLLVGGMYRQNGGGTGSPDITSFLTTFEQRNTTPVADGNSSTGTAVGYTVLTDAGFSGNGVAVFASSATSYGGEMITLRGIDATGPPAPSTLKLNFGAGDSTSAGSTSDSTSDTLSFAKSNLSNMAVGDLLIAWVHNQSSGPSTITAPAGWVRIGADLGTPNGSTSRTSGIYYYKIQTSSDITSLPSTITWLFQYAARISGHIARATGVDLTNVVDVASTQFSGSGLGGTSSFSIAALSTTVSPTLLIGGVHRQNSGGSGSPDVTSFMTIFEQRNSTPVADGNSSTGTALGYTVLTATGDTGSGVAVFASNATVFGGEMIALRASSGASLEEVAGAKVRYTSAVDTLAVGKIRYTSAIDTLAIPAEVRPFPVGYASVTSMLSQSPFYIAHRGGSLNWPEMSLYGYSQSGFWGAGALELSLARTSDGVWFGLHDASLDRTSGTTGFTASAHTWAEVQAYQITAAATNNTSQSTRPYTRWEEIMAAYYATHVIFVDPKVATAYRSELLNMMDAMPGNPQERFVCKGYGVDGNMAGTSGWAYDGSLRGYQSWGYFYQADSANFANYQGRWTILGMDYAANGATWTSIKSYGKKVIGHITPSASAATIALGFGADGLMVSGVKEVIPRFEY